MNRLSYVTDPARLAALASASILDTPAEPGFDDIVNLAAQVCAAPVALVSLVAADRQWFKARTGFELCETDLGSSVCAHALIEPDLLVIPDLTLDERTRHNPLVTGEAAIRFYAGAPFRASGTGEVLGSLCVIDRVARPEGLTQGQAEALRNLARQVTSQLDLRRAVRERDSMLVAQHQAELLRTALLLLGDSLREMSEIPDVTRGAAKIVGETLGVSRAAFAHFESGDNYLAVEPDWTAEGVSSIAGRKCIADYGMLLRGLWRGEPLIIEDTHTDPRTAGIIGELEALGSGSLVNMPVREHGRTVAVLIVHDRQKRAWPVEVIDFLRNVADRVEVGIARLKAEAEQEVLNQELSHRLKNTFASVQALALQSFRGVPDQVPVEVFLKRLHALSAAHDILLQNGRPSAGMSEIAAEVTGMLAEPGRFDISGPVVALGSRATLSVTLLLHELTTNAIKYGALSREGGRVALGWRLDDGGGMLVLDWRETGGPAAGPPSRAGFGSKLIRRGLLGMGRVEMEYLPSGLRAAFGAPVEQLRG